jgi:putative ABC transport system permease protein
MPHFSEWDFWRHDLKTGARHLIRRPWFSIPAVLTLALGIAATGAIFTVLDAVVLRPLPYSEPDRLVRLQSPVPGTGAGAVWGLSKAEHLYFQDHTASSFEALGLYVISRATLGAAGRQAEQVYFAEASSGLAEMLGARMELGRALVAKDNLQPKPAAVWLAHGFWQRRFGGDPRVVGRTVLLDGRAVQVAGVLSQGARLPEEEQLSDVRVDAWTALWLDPAQPPNASHRFRGLGRLKPGVTLAAAQEDLARLTERLPEALPEAYSRRFLHDTGFATQLVPLRDDVLGGHARVLWTLFGSVVLLLVIAGSNVANLFLAHGEARRHETSVRRVLGAGRARVLRHFLTEALLIAGSAGVLGTLLAAAGVRGLIALAPADLPRLADVRFGLAGVGFIAALSLLVAVVFGLLPMARRDVEGAVLCRAGRGVASSRRQHMARGVMVVAQFALSLVLLAGAALLVRSFLNLESVEPGVSPNGVLTFRVVLPGGRYESGPAVKAFYRMLSNRLGSMTGVSAVGLATTLPMTGYDGCSAYYPADHPPAGGEEPPCVPVYQVSRGYFQALGIQTTTESPGWDDPKDRNVLAIASHALAKRFWPGGASTGKSVRGGDGKDSFQVAALAGDVRADGCDRPATQALYLPLFADAPRDVAVVVRTEAGTPEGLAPRIRQELATLDAQVALTDVRSLSGIIAGSKARVTFSALLLGVASALALLLTAIGIYSLLVYLVVHRRCEISLRFALGAQKLAVVRLVVLQSLQCAAFGLILGLAAAYFITRLLQSLLFRVSPTDLATLGFVSVLLLLLAVAASWTPVQRATRIPPCEALRHD